MKRNNVRRLLALVLVAALCLLCGAAARPNATEIHIYSADDLVQLSKSCKLDTYSQGKTVYLDNDVDLSGSDFVPIPTFGGMFEGQGHTVSGLELSGDASHMGLFRYVQAVGTVRDLKITGNIDAAGTLNELGAAAGPPPRPRWRCHELRLYLRLLVQRHDLRRDQRRRHRGHERKQRHDL